jgi:hypothetical protein
MANGLSKRVVLRKPKIKKPIDAKPDKKHIRKPQPDLPKEEEPVIDIDETSEPTITKPEPKPITEEQETQTKPKRMLIIKKEPEIIIETPKEKTFDEKFLDKMDIKSRITKDKTTQSKIQKQELKPTRKIKSKTKKNLSPNVLISLLFFVISSVWVYRVAKDYFSGNLDNSLTTFMYLTSMGLLAIVLAAWLIIELTQEDIKYEN